jgi:hypothetical protein
MLGQGDEVGAAIARVLVADRHPLALHDVQGRDQRGRVDVGVERERLLVERPVEVEGDEDPGLGGRDPEPPLHEGLLETAPDQASQKQKRGSQSPRQARLPPHAFAGGFPIALSIH